MSVILLMRIEYLVSIKIADNFEYCQIKTGSLPINLDEVCPEDSSIKNTLLTQYIEDRKLDLIKSTVLGKEVYAFSILTDVNQRASGNAFECKKVRIFRDYRDNYLLQKFRSDSVEIIDVTQDECINMSKSKLCDGKYPLKCHRNICYYDDEPKDDDHSNWYGFSTVPFVKCYVLERKLFANNNNDMVFKSTCMAKDLYCKLKESIVVWSADAIRTCSFKFLINVNLNTKNSLSMVDEQNRLIFRVAQIKKICNYESLVTSEGIYLMPLNQLKKIDKSMEDTLIEKNNFTGKFS